jgi:hypothetical protein
VLSASVHSGAIRPADGRRRRSADGATIAAAARNYFTGILIFAILFVGFAFCGLLHLELALAPSRNVLITLWN